MESLLDAQVDSDFDDFDEDINDENDDCDESLSRSERSEADLEYAESEDENDTDDSSRSSNSSNSSSNSSISGVSSGSDDDGYGSEGSSKGEEEEGCDVEKQPDNNALIEALLKTRNKRLRISDKKDELGHKKSKFSHKRNQNATTDHKESTPKHPLNFSRVDSCLRPIDDSLRSTFPLFEDAKKRELSVDIHAGEMLYLPCGWFHEVISSNGGLASKSDSKPSFHMAVNYWFHPPDGKSFEEPYADDFWARNFKARGL
jgi:hypothetical protein